MFDNDPELNKAMEWCATARKLLGLLREDNWSKGGGYKHGQRMTKAIGELEKNLKQAQGLIANETDNNRKQQLQSDYEAHRRELLAIGQLAEASATKRSNEMAQIASDRLAVLQYTVATTYFQDEGGSQAQELQLAQQRLQEKISRYEQRYAERLIAAEQVRKTLFVLNQPGQLVGYEQPVADAITDAKRLAGLLAHSEAISVLDGVEGMLKTQQGRARADALLRTAAARDKPVFESQRRLIAAGLEKAKAIPGTKVQQQALTQALREADNLVAGPGLKYRDAFEKLRSAESLLESAKSAGQGFEKTVDQPLQGQYAAARQKLAEFETSYGLGQADTVIALGGELQRALELMDRDPPGTVQASSALDGILISIQSKTSFANQRKQHYEQNVERARVLLQEVEARARLEVYQPLLSDFRAASSEYAAQQYPSAADQLQSVLDRAAQARQTASIAFDDWGRMLIEIEGQYLGVLQQAAGIEHQDLQGAGGLLAQFIGARDFYAAQQHDFARALVIGADVKTAVDADNPPGLRKKLLEYAGLAPRRLQAQSAIEAAQATLKLLLDAGGDGAAFETELSDLARPWATLERETLDGGRLDLGLNTLAQGLQALKSRVQQVLNDPSGLLKDSQDSAKDKEQAATFKKLQTAVEAQLRRLEQENPGGADDLRQRLLVAVNLPPDQRPAALQAANDVEAEARQRLEQHQSAVADARREALAVGQLQVDAVGQLKSKFPALGKACDALMNRVNALMGLADSSVLAIVQDGKNQLTGLRAPFDLQVQTITRIAEKLEALEKLLADPVLAEHLPSRKKVLAARLEKQLPGLCAGAPDTALVPLLSGFELEINAAKQAAAEAVNWKQAIETIAKRIDQQLEQLSDAPALLKAFQARVAAARKAGEGRELGAKLDLEALEQLIAANLSKPEMLARMEQGAKQAEAATAEAQSGFEAQVEIFKLRELKAASDLHSRIAELLGTSKRNEALYAQMQQAFEDAQGLAKTGEFLRALDQLARARRLAQQYADNPDGGKATSARELQQAVDGWRKTVAEFVGSMNGVVGNMKMRCDTDDAYRDSVEAFTVALRRVALAFDASAFDGTVRALAQAQDLAEQRGAKEEGLRHLRRFQAVMEQDPVFALVGESPFGGAPTKALKDRARALEVNLKRA